MRSLVLKQKCSRGRGGRTERLDFRAATRLRSLGGALKSKREGSDAPGESALLFDFGHFSGSPKKHVVKSIFLNTSESTFLLGVVLW